MGGNIGTPVLQLPNLQPAQHYVLEISSYQIDLTPNLKPTVGVLLNLAEDHLDRHGTMELYAKIKERLVAQSESAIIGVDDDWCAAIADRVEASGVPVMRISGRKAVEHGLYADGTMITAVEKARRCSSSTWRAIWCYVAHTICRMFALRWLLDLNWA